MWFLSLRWRAALDRAVAPLGLTQAQYTALATLWGLTRGGERPSQRRLAEATELGPIYVSKLVRTLERKGLVARSPDPTDARAVRLELTSEGARVVGEAITVVRALEGDLTAVLGGPTSAEVKALKHTLKTLLQAAPRPDAALETGEEP